MSDLDGGWRRASSGSLDGRANFPSGCNCQVVFGDPGIFRGNCSLHSDHAIEVAELKAERDEARRIALVLADDFPEVLSEQDRQTVLAWREDMDDQS